MSIVDFEGMIEMGDGKAMQAQISADVVRPILSDDQRLLVLDMMRTLTAVCDNARTKDNRGFSKADLIGHYIAELPSAYFNNDWLLVALQLVLKYQRQLEGLGFDTQPFIELYGSAATAKEKADAHRSRKDRQLRRVLLTEDGRFEIYFPDKQSMQGFNTNLPVTHNWISTRIIPHGYAYIVDRTARAFVASTVKSFGAKGWFIPDEVLLAINTPIDNEIDVSDAIEYDLYILGDSLKHPLTFRWDDLYLFLNRVKAFSTRSFWGADRSWQVAISEPSDLVMLRELIALDHDIFVSKPILRELNDFDAWFEALAEKQREANAKKKQQEFENRPISHVRLVGQQSFHISFSRFSADFVDWVKSNLTERTFRNGDKPYWDVKSSENNILKLHGMLVDNDWVFDDSAAAFLREKVEKAAHKIDQEIVVKPLALRLSSQTLPSEDFELGDLPINSKLLPFQRLVLEYNSVRRNTFFADEMGLGKTISALACAANNAIADSVIVAVPAIAKLTWRDEIAKWLPGSSIHLCKAAKTKVMATREESEIKAASFVIVSYNKIPIYQDVLVRKQAKLFIADESHFLKNHKSKRTIASMAVSASCDFVYLLSGTPLKNRPRELITQLDMLGVLHSDFGGEKKFLFTYCDPKNNGWGYNFDGASNLTQLRKKLRESCMVRRLKDDVMDFLPPKRRIRVPVEIDNRKEYDKANCDFKSAVIAAVTKEAKAIARKKGLEGDEMVWFIDDFVLSRVEKSAKSQMLVHIGLLRQILARGLQSAACEWIEDFCESEGEPLVVFAYHQEMQTNIYQTLKENTELRVGKIVAGMSDEDRKKVENAFQSGQYDVLVCSIMAANTNITLTAATTVLTTEYLWVPGDHLQAEDRCRRIGTSLSAKSINCFYLHGDDTVADQFWKVISTKFGVIERAMDTDSVSSFETGDDVKAEIINGIMSQFDWIKKK